MNTISHDLIGQSVEVYIDDIVVKSKSFSEHLVDLEQALRKMRHYNLRMNPAKCAFGVASGNFLGFMVHNKVNFLRSFVSNAAEEFVWKPPHQQAFEAIKEAMANPPVLMPPQAASRETEVVCLVDILRYLLGRPALRGRQAKWAVKLAAFDLRYVPIKAAKGQVVANYLVDHPSPVADQAANRMEAVIILMPWTLMKFDGSSTQNNAEAEVFIESPWGQKWIVIRALAPGFTNNQAEYKALLVGLRILYENGAKAIRVQGDSQLILKQIAGEFQCKDERMRNLRMEAVRMLQIFDDVVVEFIHRAENRIANDLAQEASGYKSSAAGNFKSGRVHLYPMDAEDWRMELRKYLEQPTGETPEKLRKEALKYTLIDGDLFRRAAYGMLMRCVDNQEAMKVMGEVHEEICGAHKSGPVMRWTIRRYGYFWPSMTEDYIKYAQGCEACQRHGPLIRIPEEEMHAVVKPLPFRGWAMDIIGKIHPPSSRHQSFILMAMDYFTKWIEAVPLANVTYHDVIKFIK
ncbi:uncharacterized protein LOC127247153 [Andrographis paniculata]|uniref:uncharacterized protein LOC127247153 n=1 Tax=Andrographis paniculata TaxID=175694 RepID=UPI0021E86085|nr:uncharacterized protein LOC127247153 [Andrographis paniculata]